MFLFSLVLYLFTVFCLSGLVGSTPYRFIQRTPGPGPFIWLGRSDKALDFFPDPCFTDGYFVPSSFSTAVTRRTLSDLYIGFEANFNFFLASIAVDFHLILLFSYYCTYCFSRTLD